MTIVLFGAISGMSSYHVTQYFSCALFCQGGYSFQLETLIELKNDAK